MTTDKLLTRLALGIVVAIGPSFLCAGDWPAWRGPQANGTTEESAAPIRWSTTENIAWKVPLPDRGNSTPIVWKDHLFLTQPVSATQERTIVCLRRTDGQQVWQAGIKYSAAEPTHNTNPYCSASPVTDGQVVIGWFGSAGALACDLTGKKLWTRDLGKQTHEWGYGASPVLDGDRCFIQSGAGESEWIAALDKNTGDVLWKVDTPKGDEPVGEVGPDGLDDAGQQTAQQLRGAWGTPLLVRHHDRNELIVASPQRLSAYDPHTGKQLWTCRGLGPLVYASPVSDQGMVIALGGYHSASLAVRLGGSGDVTTTHRLWHQPRSRLWLGSGIFRGDTFFVQDMQGVLHCLRPQTGEVVWRERLTGSDGSNDSWSSIVQAGHRLYVLNQSGDTFVVDANEKFHQLARNSLRETTNASPVIAGKNIYIRTHNHLWCIGQR